MATKAANKRLAREYQNIQSNPPPYIVAHPSESNILEWHFLLTGPPATPYENGQYWGTLSFPSNYPFAPPAIRMHTPSGRFQPSSRLCLSISDFHPKSFNPAWSVSTILIGLMSFMNGEEMTAGSIGGTAAERKWHAARSRWWNSTGGGSASRPPIPGMNSSLKTIGVANIKAGDGGQKFRSEWPEEDEQNWKWIKEMRIDLSSGKVLPDEAEKEGEVRECSPEMQALRRRLGVVGGSAPSGPGGLGSTVAGLVHGGQAAVGREVGQGWIWRNKWWVLSGLFVIYVMFARILGDPDD